MSAVYCLDISTINVLYLKRIKITAAFFMLILIVNTIFSLNISSFNFNILNYFKSLDFFSYCSTRNKQYQQYPEGCAWMNKFKKQTVP